MLVSLNGVLFFGETDGVFKMINFDNRNLNN